MSKLRVSTVKQYINLEDLSHAFCIIRHLAQTKEIMMEEEKTKFKRHCRSAEI